MFRIGKCGLLVIVSVLASAPMLAATPMSTLASSLNPGTAAELTTTNAGPTFSVSAGGNHSVFEFTNEIAWDSAARRAYFLGTSDPNNTSGDAKFIRFDDDSNTWSTLSYPAFGNDGSPMHAYDHHAVDPVSRRMWYTPFAVNGRRELFEYSLTSGTWTERQGPTSANYVEDASAIAWFPDRNRLILWGVVNTGIRDDVWEYNPATNTWASLATNVSSIQQRIHGMAKYSAVKHMVWVGGGNSSNQMYRVRADGTVAVSAASPIDMNVNATLVVDDPVSGNYLVWRDDRFYEYDPTTDRWTNRGGSWPWQSTSFNPRLFHTVATSIPNYGVVMICQWRDGAGRVWLYKHSAGAPADPEPQAPVVTDVE